MRRAGSGTGLHHRAGCGSLPVWSWCLQFGIQFANAFLQKTFVNFPQKHILVLRMPRRLHSSPVTNDVVSRTV